MKACLQAFHHCAVDTWDMTVWRHELRHMCMCVCVCLDLWGVGRWRVERAGLQGGVKEERLGTVAEKRGSGEGGKAWGSKSQHSLCNRHGHTPHLKLIQSGRSTALPSAQDTQT